MIKLGLGLGLIRIKKRAGKNPWLGGWMDFSDSTNAFQVVLISGF